LSIGVAAVAVAARRRREVFFFQNRAWFQEQKQKN